MGPAARFWRFATLKGSGCLFNPRLQRPNWKEMSSLRVDYHLLSISSIFSLVTRLAGSFVGINFASIVEEHFVCLVSFLFFFYFLKWKLPWHEECLLHCNQGWWGKAPNVWQFFPEAQNHYGLMLFNKSAVVNLLLSEIMWQGPRHSLVTCITLEFQ